MYAFDCPDPGARSRSWPWIAAALTLAAGMLWGQSARPASVSEAPQEIHADQVDVSALLGMAEQGDSRAAYLLGTRYASGRAGVRDDSEAVRWFRKAAEGGLAEAQYNLAIMYARGRGVERDPIQSARWLQAAAGQGLARAQFNLGTYYASGQGVAVDPAQAVRWLGKAAAQGLPQAQYNLGLMFEFGQGVPRDLDQARAWYRRAEAGGLAEAGKRARALTAALNNPAAPVPAPSSGLAATPVAASESPLARLRRQDRSQYTIQLYSGTREEDARAFVQHNALDDHAVVVAAGAQGRGRVQVVYGVYPTYEAAQAARKKLPPGVQTGGPWVRRLDAVLGPP